MFLVSFQVLCQALVILPYSPSSLMSTSLMTWPIFCNIIFSIFSLTDFTPSSLLRPSLCICIRGGFPLFDQMFLYFLFIDCCNVLVSPSCQVLAWQSNSILDSTQLLLVLSWRFLTLLTDSWLSSMPCLLWLSWFSIWYPLQLPQNIQAFLSFLLPLHQNSIFLFVIIIPFLKFIHDKFYLWLISSFFPKKPLSSLIFLATEFNESHLFSFGKLLPGTNL